LIINPEFGKSLKESLKRSTRRLLLFIDGKDGREDMVQKRVSLGLREEESVEAEEDLCN
jgi:hypothetical protein